jgi:hypothetical protein
LEVIPAVLVIITLDGPDAEEAANELGARLENMRERPDGLTFNWQTETVVVAGKPEKKKEPCPWWS